MELPWWQTETFTVVIQRILTENISINDDTLFEKLLTEIDNLRLPKEKTEKLLKAADVDLLTKIVSSLDDSSEVLSFALKLTASLVRHDLISEHEDFAKTLITYWCDRWGSSKSATVRSAGLVMCQRFAEDEKGLLLLTKTGVLKTALLRLSDESLFVSSSSRKFIVTYLIRLFETKFGGAVLTSRNAGTEVLTQLLQTLSLFTSRVRAKTEGSPELSTLNSVLAIIKEPPICENLLTTCPEIANKLLDIVRIYGNDKAIALSLCELLMIAYREVNPELWFPKSISIITKSCSVTVIQKFGVLVLSRFSDLNSDIERDAQLEILRPLEYTFGKSGLPLKEFLASISLVSLNGEKIRDPSLRIKTLIWLCTLLEEAHNTNARYTVKVNVLEALKTLLSLWPTDYSVILRTLTLLSVILSKENSSPQECIYAAAVLNAVHRGHSCQCSEDQPIHHLSQRIVEKLLTHPEWEVKDTALELVSNLSVSSEKSFCGVIWLVNSGVPSQVLKFLNEEDSFVRASALSTLGVMSKNTVLWNELVNKSSEDEILDQVIHLLHDDTEALVRRSAISLLIKWYQDEMICNKSRKIKILTSVEKSRKDLDWEVKLFVLDFWENIFKHIQQDLQIEHSFTEVPVYAAAFVDIAANSNKPPDKATLHKALELLNEFGFCKSLLYLMDDCDVSVKFKAASLMRQVKKPFAYDGGHVVTSKTDFSVGGEIECTVKSGEACIAEDEKYVRSVNSVPMDANVLEEVLETSDREAVESLACAKHEASEVETCIEALTTNLESFLSYLQDTDFDSIVEECDKSTDLYANNVELLLADILACSSNDKDVNAIDCY